MTELEGGAASVMIDFNNGMLGMLRVLTKWGIMPGSNCIDYCNESDHAQIYTKWTASVI